MGRKAEVSLYRLFNVEGTHRYVRIVKSGRGWAKAVGDSFLGLYAASLTDDKARPCFP